MGLLDSLPGKLRGKSKKKAVPDYVRKQLNKSKKHKQVEERVKESIEGYRLLFERIGYVTWITDNKGKITFISPNVKNVYGYIPKEIYNGREHPFFGKVHPNDAKGLKKAWELLFKKGKEYNIEYRIQRKDGKWIWLLDKAVSVHRKDGKSYAFGAFSDITEQKKVEDRIKHLNRVLRTIHNVNQLITREKDGYKLLDSCCKILTEFGGYKSAWITLFDKNGKLKVRGSSKMAKEFSSIVKMFDKGKTTRCVKMALEKPRVVVMTSVAKSCKNCSLSKYCGENGAVIMQFKYGKKAHGTVAVITPEKYALDKEEQHLFKEVVNDISFALRNIELEEERRMLEEELRKKEEKYRLISENTSDLVAMTTFGLNPVYTYVSPSIRKVFGYEPEDMIGKSGFEFIHPDDKKKLLPLLEKYIVAGAQGLLTGKGVDIFESIEYRFKDRYGKWHWLESTANLVGNEMLFVSRDITERKQLEQTKTDFLNLVSHELKTPLTATKAYLGLLREELESRLSESEVSNFETVDRNIKQLEKLVLSILDISHMESGKLKLNLEKVDVEMLIKDISEQFRLLVVKKDLKLVKRIDKLPKVKADKSALKKILNNLLSNAIKFTEKGVITIKAKRKGEFVEISVTDTGIGIPKDVIPNLFRRFYQADLSLRRKHGGTGLGLSIVKMFVELHSGEVKVKSKKGEGSTFTFTLPIKGPEGVSKA